MTEAAQGVWSTVVKRAAGKGSKDVDALSNQQVEKSIDEFNDLFHGEDQSNLGQDQKKIDARKGKYATMVNHYYDLATDFYEYGWGQSFHFAPRFPGESFDASIARHEHYLAARLGLKPGMVTLDAGCGVGGPMRAIARFSGSKVVGITINDYQVKRGNLLNQQKKLDHLASLVKGDFMNLQFPAESFDAVYAIEATCHAPDKAKCFAQMFKVLKPGAMFAGYEWVMTPKYDAKNDEHRLVKHMIEHGDALPDLATPQIVVDALKTAGFEVIEHFDVAETAKKDGNDVTWYSTLQGSFSLTTLQHTKGGRFLTQKMVDVMETLRIAPKGTSKTHQMLCIGADGLVRGGELGIFTPMYFFIARKPLRQ